MILFLDNIRGFNKAFIEINDVNFLIGENSTGKTTVMSILSLLSDENFLRTGAFKNQFVDFGPFKEIINQNDKNKESFAIGVLYSKRSSFLLIYNELDGFPTLSQFYYQVEDILIKYSLIGESIQSSSAIKIIEKIQETKDIFSNWTDTNYKVEKWHKSKYHSRHMRDDPTIIPMMLSRDDDTSLMIKDFGYINKFFNRETVWIDPIRSKPQRVYEPQKNDYSAEGAHTPSVLRNIFSKPNMPESKKIIKTIHSFGKASGLFDEIVVDSYRKTIESPFELHFKLKGKELKISNVGYGISQVLPIITEIALRKADAFFLIQQPEVHLHPKSQAFFGQFFFDQFAENWKSFVIETHSDFILDRFRLMIRKTSKGHLHDRVNFLFFESTEEGNKVTQIKIDKNGDYPTDQPEKFRDFFLKEEMALLGF